MTIVLKGYDDDANNNVTLGVTTHGDQLLLTLASDGGDTEAGAGSWLTSAQARALSAALVAWADRVDGAAAILRGAVPETPETPVAELTRQLAESQNTEAAAIAALRSTVKRHDTLEPACYCCPPLGNEPRCSKPAWCADVHRVLSRTVTPVSSKFIALRTALAAERKQLRDGGVALFKEIDVLLPRADREYLASILDRLLQAHPE